MAGIDMQIVFEKGKPFYQLGERVTGKLIVSGNQQVRVKELGYELYFHCFGTVIRVGRKILDKHTNVGNGDHREYPFTLINDVFETFKAREFSYQFEIRPFVETDTILPQFKRKRRGREIVFTSNRPYEVLQENVSFPNAWPWLVLFPVMFAFAVLAHAHIPLLILLPIGLSVILLSYIAGSYIVGKIGLDLVPVDGESFNVVSSNPGPWKFVRSGTIHYRIIGNAIQNPDNRGESGNTRTFYVSPKVAFDRSSGMWASLQFPTKRNLPATNRIDSRIAIRWELLVRLKTRFGWTYRFDTEFVVRRSME